ncbi:MAG: acyl-[acyl-carrier-protein] thioesterase [Lachnospiraceae bacterium]|nr:acyl-[acyl-carrier-protein] thioesterase [Lachnospiraceae bacterium]
MYSMERTVSYSEIDMDLNLSIPGLVRYLQDVVIFDSESRGADIEYLAKVHRAWVLGAWQIVIDRIPRFREEVRITTFPYDFKGFIGYRNFVIESMDGECLVRVNSMWSHMDTEAMRPVKPTDEMMQHYQTSEKLDMDYAPRKIAVSGEGVEIEHIKVRKSQIDTNHHVNNTEYIAMAYEYLPDGVTVKQLRTEYKKPALMNDEIVPIVYQTEDRMIVQLDSIEQEVYAVVEFTYE